MNLYHEHSRALQDRFDSRRIADRLAEKLLRAEFSDEDRSFIDYTVTDLGDWLHEILED